MPKVSVVIPVYNCEKFISTAIESVLGQTYGDYEIIAVNDGSTDKTDEVLSRYASKIRKIYQPNKGPAEARNTGIANSGGEYIAFLDQDDAWLPDKLKKQVEAMERNDRAGLVYTDMYILEDKAFAGTDYRLRSFQLRRPRRGRVLEDLFLDNFIATSSVMVRKECITKAGRFDPSLVPAEDYDMWLRISSEDEVDYVDAPLVKFRDHVACFRGNRIVALTHIMDALDKALSDYPDLKGTLGKKAGQKLSYFRIMRGKVYLSKMLFKGAFRDFYAAFRLTGSLLTPFNILFSYVSDAAMGISRRIKARNRNGR